MQVLVDAAIVLLMSICLAAAILATGVSVHLWFEGGRDHWSPRRLFWVQTTWGVAALVALFSFLVMLAGAS